MEGDGTGREAFGALLRRYRQRAALSQAALAERAGLSVDAVGVIERGRRGAPRPDTVALLARALDLEGEERTGFIAATRAGSVAAQPPWQFTVAPTIAAPAGSIERAWRPGTLGGPDLLVGRAREQETLRACLSAALAGEGRLVLLGGEAGIGKSALAEALQREARTRGALLLTGHAYDLTDTPPYGPWIDLLQRSPRPGDLPPLPAIARSGMAEGGPDGGPGSQLALFAEVCSFLTALAARQPLMLLLEDLHWADPASLDLLRYAARECGDLPLLVLATYRADEVTRRHALFGLLPLLAREGRALRLDLRRLDDAAVRALLRGRYGLAADDEDRLLSHLRARAEGNPLFVGELLRTLEEEGVLRVPVDGHALGDLSRVRLPPFLRQVIEARLSRLGEATRGLLAVAAIIGQEVPLTLWQDVASVADDALLDAVERAVEMHAVEETEDGAGVRFAHALIREALYDGLLAPRRQAWHRRVGEALAAAPAPDPDVVAYHFRQARDERALDWLVRAGERARHSYAWLTAAARFETALALMPTEDASAERRGALLGYLGWLRRYADPSQAIAYLDEALRLAEGSADRALAASSLFFRGITRCYTGGMREGVGEMEAAAVALDALSPQERARMATLGMPATVLTRMNGWGTAALWLALTGRYDAAQELVNRDATQGVDEPRLHMGASTHGDAYQGSALIHAAWGRLGEARRSFARAREIYRAVEHHYQFATTAAWELQDVALPYLADQPAELRQLAALAEQAWARSSGAWSGVVPGVAQLPVLLLGGRWTEARRVAEEARTVPGIVNQRLFAAATLGPLALYQGDADLAWEVVAMVLPEGPETVPGDTWLLTALILQRVAVQLSLDASDLPRAHAWLRALDRWLGWSGCVSGRAEGQLSWAAYYRETGDVRAAVICAEQSLEFAATPRQPLALLGAHRLLGEIVNAAGKPETARAQLATSLQLADACAAPFERALALAALAEVQMTSGQHAEAAAGLDEARAICQPLQAGPALARLARLTQSHGNGRPAAHYPSGLSSREVEVLRLVSRGLSNIEVSEQLVLSPRTVEQHVRSIYNKLGVSSRSAATRFAIEQGLG